jgi:integrase/recombinase XerD
MSALVEAVNDYLALRRSLGYKLEAHGRLLPQFAAFLDQCQVTVITTVLALEWATEPAEGSVVWWHQRLAIAAGFARYLQASDPRHEVPATDLLPAKFRRAIGTPPEPWTLDR